MKVSLNIVKQLVGFELLPVDELVSRINQQLGKVEEIIDLGSRYRDARIVVVAKCVKHPNADRLSVCLIDDGGIAQNIERDEDGLIQVVCGAPNVKGGMLAVWLPPKSTVPATYGDDEPFVLDTRELRGVTSNGMLAAADELAIGSDHDGIVEITEYDLPEGVEKNDDLIGKSFAEMFGLDDTIIDIENKMFTHRPDCFGQLGVARELNAILQPEPQADDPLDNRYENDDWYWRMPSFDEASGLELAVHNEAKQKVPRFMAVAMMDVTIAPSPMWLQCALVALGSKPINNIVDLTNYLMLMTAQPTHAYDYDKLRGKTLSTRMANNGEVTTLLNGKTYELTHEDIVIVDAEGIVGLGGIMGGGTSEVSNETKNIVLEVANFDMYAVRKSSMRHGIFTDALTRFNKGQSPLQNDRVLKQLMKMVQDIAGGMQASNVTDLMSEELHEAYHSQSFTGEIEVDADFVNARLGTSLSPAQIGNILRPANFAAYQSEDNENVMMVCAPFWRTDIAVPEDLVEEVGRLYGFDKLPRELPRRSITPAPENAELQLMRRIRDALKRAGANEVLTYSFVHERVMKNATQDVSQAYKISNALSPELQYYRLSVLPSLLDKVHTNIKSGHDEFTLYEIGKGHNKNEVSEDGLPKEIRYIDAVYASKQPRPGAPFYHIRAMVDQLAEDLGLTLVYEAADTSMDYPFTAPFELSRAAMVTTERGEFIGMVGELKQPVRRSFKLPAYTAAASLDFNSLLSIVTKRTVQYQPLSKYPATSRDVSLRVGNNVRFGAVERMLSNAAEKQNGRVTVAISPRDIYQPDDRSSTTFTFRFSLTSHDKTLTDNDAKTIVDEIVDPVIAAFKAEVV